MMIVKGRPARTSEPAGRPADQIYQQQLRVGEHPVDLADRMPLRVGSRNRRQKDRVGRRMHLFVEVAACGQVVDFPVGRA